MAVTYTAIANATLSSAQNVISITNIPSTYTDLRITFYAYSVDGATILQLGTNTDTTGAYWGQQIYSAYGTAKLTSRLDSQNYLRLNQRANMSTDSQDYLQGWVDIFSYSNINLPKSTLSFTGMQNNLVERSVGLCLPNATVSSVQLRVNTGNMGIGSRMAVYGILRA